MGKQKLTGVMNLPDNDRQTLPNETEVVMAIYVINFSSIWDFGTFARL